jgi:hypothetical protein
MKIVTVQMIAEPKPFAIIVEVDEGECCPRCGAPLKEGQSVCAYCKTQVIDMVQDA